MEYQNIKPFSCVNSLLFSHIDVRCASRAVIKLGLEPRRAVAIMGFNSPEWFISDLAAVFSGGVAVGIYPTNSPDTTK